MFAQLTAFDFHRDDPLHRVVRTDAEFQQAATWLAQQPFLGMDTETSGLAWYRDASICGVAAGAPLADGRVQSFYFPVRHQTGERQLAADRVFALARELLGNPHRTVAFYNQKFDQHMFARENVPILCPTRDVMVEAHLYNENAPLALKERAVLDLGDENAQIHEKVLGRWLNRLAKESCCKVAEYRERFGYARLPVTLTGVYACHDIEFTLRLAQFYDARSVRQFFSAIYQTEMDLIPVLCEMEANGMPVNPEYLVWLEHETHAAMDTLRPQLWASVNGYQFNPDSDEEVAHVIQKVIGHKLTKLTKGSLKELYRIEAMERAGYGGSDHVPEYTVDAEVLGSLDHPLGKLLLAYREAAKINGTYTTSILTRRGNDGFVHGDIKSLGTKTGRLSMEKPNLQNQPSDSDDRAKEYSGKKLEDGGVDPWSVRRAFVCRSPHHCRLFADYSQVELRVMAFESGDPVMREAYLLGQDIHDRTSLEVFGSIEKALRRKAKVINFGLSYCMSAMGYARQTGVSVEQGEEDMAKFFARYSRIAEFRKELWARCRRHNPPAFINLFGRPRRIPAMAAQEKSLRARGERQAIGAYIQGTAAELTKASLVRIWRWEQQARTGLKLCSTIHDEIAVDVEKELAYPVVQAIVPLMETYPQFNPIPILVDVEYTDTDWSEKRDLPEGWVNHVWRPS